MTMKTKLRHPALFLAFALILSSSFDSSLGFAVAFAQDGRRTTQPASQDDPDFADFVKKATTKPEFLSPLVDHLPKKAGVPTPKDVLGYHIGTEK
jgi:hypothetical protein